MKKVRAFIVVLPLMLVMLVGPVSTSLFITFNAEAASLVTVSTASSRDLP